jgi:hypothetical protein
LLLREAGVKLDAEDLREVYFRENNIAISIPVMGAALERTNNICRIAREKRSWAIHWYEELQRREM